MYLSPKKFRHSKSALVVLMISSLFKINTEVLNYGVTLMSLEV